jgi:hypothetical protein
MSAVWLTPVLTGSFALIGGLGGVILSNYLASRTDEKRTANEDERRWLVDRRNLYAKYLGLMTSMLKGIESASIFLSYDGTKPITEEDEELVKEDVLDLYARWDDEVQFMLGEVQLIAAPKVAELADRTSWALMMLIGDMDSRKTWLGDIDTRKTFQEVNAAYYRTLHLVEALRNAMRDELGLTDPVHTWPKSGEWLDWPWLSDKPIELHETEKDNVTDEDQTDKA